MSAQEKYCSRTQKFVAGGIYDSFHYPVDSRLNEEDTGKIKPGMAVVVGSKAGSSVKLPVATSVAKDFEGVVVNGFTNSHDLEGHVYVAKDATLGVGSKGRFGVIVAGTPTIAYGDDVYMVVSGANAGMFTNVAEGNVKLNAKFIQGVDNGIAVIDVFPGEPNPEIPEPNPED